MKSLAEPENEQNVFASVQYLKSKLIEKYGEREIGFANMSNRSDVVYFKTSSFDRIIHDSWYTKRCNDVESESTRIVETAAKLIKMQLRSTKYEMKSYPSTQMIADTKYNKEWMPKLLQIFMKAMIGNELKQASIG